LRQPAPAADANGQTTTLPVNLSVPGPSATGARGDGWQQVQDQLATRGVTYQHLETSGDDGRWKFSCAIPDRRNPATRHVYEAVAAGESGLAAIRAVLAQIDQEPR
jgi:hypothetical protein